MFEMCKISISTSTWRYIFGIGLIFMAVGHVSESTERPCKSAYLQELHLSFQNNQKLLVNSTWAWRYTTSNTNDFPKNRDLNIWNKCNDIRNKSLYIYIYIRLSFLHHQRCLLRSGYPSAVHLLSNTTFSWRRVWQQF